jgi:hypothetical protein
MRFTVVVLMLAGTNVTADTVIHRCSLEDGTIAFQETPCAEPAVNADDGIEAGKNHPDHGTAAADDEVFDFVNPFDDPVSPPAPPEATLPERVSQNRAECEKTTRNAIDVIDLEMRENAYTKEQGREYLVELLRLTQRLRACKQL